MWPSESQDAAVAGARSVAAAAATALVETSKYTLLQRMRKEGRMSEVFFCPFIFLATASTGRGEGNFLEGINFVSGRTSLRPSEDDFPLILPF